MHYTIPDNRPFITKKELKRTAKVPHMSIVINDFLRTHDLSIESDPVTKKPYTVVMNKNDK